MSKIISHERSVIRFQIVAPESKRKPAITKKNTHTHKKAAAFLPSVLPSKEELPTVRWVLGEDVWHGADEHSPFLRCCFTHWRDYFEEFMQRNWSRARAFSFLAGDAEELTWPKCTQLRLKVKFNYYLNFCSLIDSRQEGLSKRVHYDRERESNSLFFGFALLSLGNESFSLDEQESY